MQIREWNRFDVKEMGAADIADFFIKGHLREDAIDPLLHVV